MVTKVYFKPNDYFRLEGPDNVISMRERREEALIWMNSVLPSTLLSMLSEERSVVLLDYSTRADNSGGIKIGYGFRYFREMDNHEKPVYEIALESTGFSNLSLLGKQSAEYLLQGTESDRKFPLYIFGFLVSQGRLSASKVYLTDCKQPGISPMFELPSEVTLAKLDALLTFWKTKAHTNIVAIANMLCGYSFEPAFYGIDQDTRSNISFKVYFRTNKKCFDFINTFLNFNLISLESVRMIGRLFEKGYYVEVVALSFNGNQINGIQLYFKC